MFPTTYKATLMDDGGGKIPARFFRSPEAQFISFQLTEEPYYD